MDPTILGSLIVSIASILLAIWSFLTSKAAKSLALKAEEAAKQTEQVRVKALSASEDIFSAIYAAKDSIATLEMFIDDDKGVSGQRVLEFNKVHGGHLKSIKDAFYKTRVYWTPEIQDRIEALLENLRHFSMNKEFISNMINDIDREARELNHMMKKVYLKDIFFK